MTDKNANIDTQPKDGRDHRVVGEDVAGISGDPGVGGLLADPQQAAKVKRRAKTPPGPPTPDPELPRAHGDWAPNRAWHGQASNEPKPRDGKTGN